MNIPCWSAAADGAGQTRTVSYVMPILRNAIGPRSALCHLYQSLVRANDGCCFVVEVLSTTPDVPYGNTYRNRVRYCLTTESERRCRLRITSELTFVCFTIARRAWRAWPSRVAPRSRHGHATAFISSAAESGMRKYSADLLSYIRATEAALRADRNRQLDSTHERAVEAAMRHSLQAQQPDAPDATPTAAEPKTVGRCAPHGSTNGAAVSVQPELHDADVDGASMRRGRAPAGQGDPATPPPATASGASALVPRHTAHHESGVVRGFSNGPCDKASPAAQQRAAAKPQTRDRPRIVPMCTLLLLGLLGLLLCILYASVAGYIRLRYLEESLQQRAATATTHRAGVGSLN